MAVDKGRRLGRGLEALLSNARSPGATAPSGPAGTGSAPGAEAGDPVARDRGELRRLPLESIRANPFQPRRDFREEELADLEASLRTSGLLQPVIVRPAPGGRPGFELIAGERRLRAAARLGWTEIPALVKEVEDRELMTLAMVENLQRADLSPVEAAEGYQRMMEEFGLTQQEVADVVGKDRSTVANTVRILALPTAVRRMLQDGQLSMGHARALLAVPDERRMAELARETIAEELTVREVERRARERGGRKRPATGVDRGGGGKGTSQGSGADSRGAEVRRIENALRRYLQTDVSIALSGSEKGEVRVSFYSGDDLQRVLELMTGVREELE